MRLFYVSHSFPPEDRPLENVGGMQRAATELHAALLGDPGVEVSSLLLRASWRWTHVRIVPFAGRLLRELPRRARREGIDAVLFSSLVTAALALPLRRRLERDRIVTAAIPVGRDVTLPVPPYQWLVPRVFRSLDALFPISRATADECVVRGASPERVHVVPCGVDLARFPPAADRTAARRSLLAAAGAADALPADSLLLCSVGRHVERKGFAWFVDQVMPRLPETVHFWLAGGGPRTAAVRDAVGRHGLEDRVRLLGRVSEPMLGRLLRGADLFVMPNRPVAGDLEGFGIVMLEAGSSGLPVVAADIEGIRDVVREGGNGHLVETGDAAAFADRILAYHRDRAALAAASARASEYTAVTFTWPAIAERYIRVLHQLVRQKRSLPGDPGTANAVPAEQSPSIQNRGQA